MEAAPVNLLAFAVAEAIVRERTAVILHAGHEAPPRQALADAFEMTLAEAATRAYRDDKELVAFAIGDMQCIQRLRASA